MPGRSWEENNFPEVIWRMSFFFLSISFFYAYSMLSNHPQHSLAALHCYLCICTTLLIWILRLLWKQNFLLKSKTNMNLQNYFLLLDKIPFKRGNNRKILGFWQKIHKKKVDYVRTSSIQNKMLKEKYPPVLTVVSVIILFMHFSLQEYFAFCKLLNLFYELWRRI